jgi:hypothetical protein
VAQTDRIGPKRKSKPAYFATATKLFPGLSCATLNAARAIADDKKATLIAALEKACDPAANAALIHSHHAFELCDISVGVERHRFNQCQNREEAAR